MLINKVMRKEKKKEKAIHIKQMYITSRNKAWFMIIVLTYEFGYKAYLVLITISVRFL